MAPYFSFAISVLTILHFCKTVLLAAHLKRIQRKTDERSKYVLQLQIPITINHEYGTEKII